MLKAIVKSKSEIPAGLESFYVEQEGAFVLDVDDRARVAEFRLNNKTLKEKIEAQTAELEALKKQFEGLDAAEARRIMAEHNTLLEQQQLKSGDVEKVVTARVAAVKGEAEKQVAALSASVAALNQRLAAIQIDQGVVELATKRGLRPTAIPDITYRARTALRLVDGVPAVFEAGGQSRRAGKDGVTPMSVEEWIETQASDAPHLFEPNAGGGAAGNGAGGAAGGRQTGRNPFLRESWNLTEQMKVMKSDPALAARLKAAA